ncbi:hypothetical protein DF153_25010 [Burkholderia cenocepacia]|nr:hypothetical protein CFB81_06275 [Burkholderia sp. AU28863]RQU18727.1 hypothetical protein DF153_25010 [Burkholderia cenocepacia]RQU22286.1 hypothetical protein DF152_04030 [Burkholderia cenocepacia]
MRRVPPHCQTHCSHWSSWAGHHQCLSRTYKNAATKLEWACAHGHHWSAVPGAIVAGRWCRVCAYDGRKLGLKLMRTIQGSAAVDASRRSM